MAASNVIAGLAGEVPSEAAAKESMFIVLRLELSCCLHFNFSFLFLFTRSKCLEANHCLQTGSYLN